MSHAKHSHPKNVALPKGAFLLKLLSAFCVINSVGATAVPALNGGAATADPSPTSSSPLPHYTLMNDALSWDDANAACLAAGLQLATVQSAAQNALLLTAAAGNYVWIGGTDAASEGAWVWSPSNTPLSYTNWRVASGEPNNVNGGEDCLEFDAAWSVDAGTWNDAPCTNKFKYVCQQPH